MDSQWTHKGLTKDSHRIHTKIIEKALVLQGCPQKVLFYIGVTRLSAKSVVFTLFFTRVVREQCCFYTGFTRVVREQVKKNLCENKIFRGQPTRHAFGTEEVNWPHNSPSFTIESPLARPHFASPRPLAGTNETKRFPGWQFHKLTHPPNLQ